MVFIIQLRAKRWQEGTDTLANNEALARLYVSFLKKRDSSLILVMVK